MCIPNWERGSAFRLSIASHARSCRQLCTALPVELEADSGVRRGFSCSDIHSVPLRSQEEQSSSSLLLPRSRFPVQASDLQPPESLLSSNFVEVRLARRLRLDASHFCPRCQKEKPRGGRADRTAEKRRISKSNFSLGHSGVETEEKTKRDSFLPSLLDGFLAKAP